MQSAIGILCVVLLVNFIVFAYRQGLKVTPDRSANGINNDTNQFTGG